MKALIFRETGEPNSILKLAEIPTPPLAPDEALVRVLLSPINPSDLHMVRGRYGYQPELPASPGAEGIGIVEAIGPGVQGPVVGTRVVFVHTWNTWREQIVCPVDRLVPVPDGLNDSAAATSYTNPLTAWALTRSSHTLKEGDWLLQTAAASSVGKLVLQLAQQYRFKTINVVRRREQETIIPNLVTAFRFFDHSATSERLACSVGGESHRGKSRNPVAWVAFRGGNEADEANRQSRPWDGERVTGPQRK
jgi:NADPH:quinone reductase-like Zn-dependent oxidoreductase